MPLIDTDEDEREVLRLEDQAILDADTPREEEVIPIGDTLADLIESLSHDPAKTLQQG